MTITTAQGGLECVAVQTPAARGVVYLQGAHVTEYQPAGAEPVLFVSQARPLST